MPRLYMIRHGRPAAVWGQDDEDPGLDEAGRAQAEAARDWLLALPPSERPRRVVSSPLRRCRETAEPTAVALGVVAEIDPSVGDLDYDQWRQAVATSLLGRADTAVFSHYVAINAVVSQLTGDPKVLSFRPDHTSITVLETDGERLRLIAKGHEAATSVL